MTCSTPAFMLVIMTAVPFFLPIMMAKAQELVDILPGCAQYDNFLEVASCLVDYNDPRCFNQNTPVILAQCFLDEWSGVDEPNITGIVETIYETAITCFDPYADCVNETIQQARENLEPCVETTGIALAQCFIDNVEECAAACLSTEWDSPYAGLNPTDLVGCAAIASNVVYPACEVLACCPPCLDAFEDLAECVVNDVLEVTLRACDFECDNAPGLTRRRHRGLQTVVDPSDCTTTNCVPVVDPTDDATTIWNRCGSLTPGIITANQPARELVARSNFVDCVVEESLGLYAYTLQETQTPTQSPTESPTQPPAESGGAAANFCYGMTLGLALVTYKFY